MIFSFESYGDIYDRLREKILVIHSRKNLNQSSIKENKSNIIKNEDNGLIEKPNVINYSNKDNKTKIELISSNGTFRSKNDILNALIQRAFKTLDLIGFIKKVYIELV